MMDPATITTGIGIAKSALQLAEWLKGIGDATVRSALFNFQGTRLEGDPKIEIERHSPPNKPEIWWFSVKPVEDYVFIRFPLSESGLYELIGVIEGETNPDSRYWRYVAEPLKGRIYGGDTPPNAKVGFIVIAYKPKTIIKHFSK